jgi:hypothetical protein
MSLMSKMDKMERSGVSDDALKYSKLIAERYDSANNFEYFQSFDG